MTVSKHDITTRLGSREADVDSSPSQALSSHPQAFSASLGVDDAPEEISDGLNRDSLFCLETHITRETSFASVYNGVCV
jgi:hypothetical protein